MAERPSGETEVAPSDARCLLICLSTRSLARMSSAFTTGTSSSLGCVMFTAADQKPRDRSWG